MEKLLILNPGSTSTKIAYYEDEKQIFVESISHSADEIAKYDLIVDQYEFRKDMIMEVLKEKNVKLEELTRESLPVVVYFRLFRQVLTV